MGEDCPRLHLRWPAGWGGDVMVGYGVGEALYTHDTTTQPPKLNVAIVNGRLMVAMTYKLSHQPAFTLHHPLRSIHKQGKARRKLLKRYRVNRYWARRTAGPMQVRVLRTYWATGGGPNPAWVVAKKPLRKSIWQRIGGWL